MPLRIEVVRHCSIPASNKTLEALPRLRHSLDAGAYRYSCARPRAVVHCVLVEGYCGSASGCRRFLPYFVLPGTGAGHATDAADAAAASDPAPKAGAIHPKEGQQEA